MKYNIYYFDPKVRKMLLTKVSEDGSKKKTISAFHNFVFKGDIVAQIVAAETKEDVRKYIDQKKSYCAVSNVHVHKCGNGIQYLDDRRCYVADYYGFVVVNTQGEIEILPAIELTKNKTVAYLYLLSGYPEKALSVEHIQKIISENKLIYIKSTEEISAQLLQVDHNQKNLYRIKIAEGKTPQNGNPDLYKCLIDLNKRAGKILENGSIDFRELNSVIEVKKGTNVLEHFPATENLDGIDVYGNVINAEAKNIKTLVPGKNLIPSTVFGEENYYVAQIDGCLVVDSEKISVDDVLTIYSDLDYETGNLDVMGSVVIKGDVKPGFSIKAGGDILIEGNCDDANIEAGGTITVYGGILGHGNAKLKAGVSLVGRFALNAELTACNFVEIQDSIINCCVSSDHAIIVTDQHGRIMGGKYIAKYLICSHYIGSENGAKTNLIVGISPKYEKTYEELKKIHDENAKTLQEKIDQLYSLFGKDALKKPKQVLQSLPQGRQEKFTSMISEVVKKTNELKKLAFDVEDIKAKMRLRKSPLINVPGTIYPGVDLHIGNLKRVIEKKIEYCSFYESKENLIAFREAEVVDLQQIESFREDSIDEQEDLIIEELEIDDVLDLE